MKWFATGLLVAVTIVFVVARTLRDDAGTWLGYVEAFAEAAMVGALADWFAVTALFRHPLGLPIPHTAIIPKRKDQIGESLGQFVQENFLTEELLNERLQKAHVGAAPRRMAVAPGQRAAGLRRCRRRAARRARGGRRRGDLGIDRGDGGAPHPGHAGRAADGPGDRRRRRERPPPTAARRHDDRAEELPRRQPQHVPRTTADRVAVVGAGDHRRPHLRQDLHRRAPLPRRRRPRPPPRGPPLDRPTRGRLRATPRATTRSWWPRARRSRTNCSPTPTSAPGSHRCGAR